MKLSRMMLVVMFLSLSACWKPYGDGVGIYYKEGSDTDYTELRADGTYVVQERGQRLTGKYSVRWNTLTLQLPSGGTATGKLHEGRILDNQKQVWLTR